MISLDQIRTLETKINLLVEELTRLREENVKLKSTVKSTQAKMTDLESMINTYKQEQEAIEQGILSVLSKLDKLEDEICLSGTALTDDSTRPPKAGAAVSRETKHTEKAAKAAAAKTKSEKPAENEKQDELDIF